MENGCKVKLRVKDQWRHGTLLNKDNLLCGLGEPHYFNYEERHYDRSDIKEFVPLDEEVAEATHQKELQSAFVMAQEAFADLMPNEKVEIKDNCLSCMGVTLDPVIHEKETIARFVEVAAWQVNIWKHHPATRWEPEDYSDCPVGSPTNYQCAVQLFVLTVFKLKADCYWDAKADEAFARSLAEEGII
jgi:hypothetical protein